MSRPGYPFQSGRARARLVASVAVIVLVLLVGTCGFLPEDRLHGVDMWWCSRTKTVVFSSMGRETAPLDDNKLYALDVPTGRVRVLLTTEDCLDTPVLSPDGTQLACRVTTPDRSALLVGRADGLRMRKIAWPTDRWFWPNSFAMKGGAVVLSSLREVPGRGFAARPRCEADFWLASLATGRVRRITTGNFAILDRPGVSADGRTLTFIATPQHREGGPASFVYQCSLIGDGRLKRLWQVGEGDADCVGTDLGGDVRFAGYTIPLKGPDVSQMSLRTGKAEVLCQGMPWSDSGVFWSEDGRQAMYLSNRHGPGLALVLLDVPTCTVRVVAGSRLFEDPLGWDPGEDRYRDP